MNDVDYSIDVCPCCGSEAEIKDLTRNKIGHKGVLFGRIVCKRNNSACSDRCYVKTVCGELDKVVLSWNKRSHKEELDRLKEVEWMYEELCE